jgi:hypothetical protein
VDPAHPDHAANGSLLADMPNFVWVQGIAQADNFDAALNISSSTRALMSQYQRGIWLDLRGGGDHAIGSAYGDDFTTGAGVNYIDGGDNTGTPPGSSGTATDALHIYVADQAAADAVSATELTGTLSGADATAQAEGYRFKITAGNEIDYVKNVERVSVAIWNDANHNGMRDQNEVTFARDFQPGSTQQQQPDPSTMLYMADIKGTPQDDNFSASGLPAETTALMNNYQRGVHYDLGEGNDTVVGSNFGDGFTAGAGINRIDGGDNTGTPPGGGTARDVLEVTVADQTAADAINAVELTGTLTGADAEAQTAGYRYKVVASGGTTYLKNVESVSISIWNDANHDGMLNGGEVAFARNIDLNPPTAMGGAPFEAVLTGTSGTLGDGLW